VDTDADEAATAASSNEGETDNVAADERATNEAPADPEGAPDPADVVEADTFAADRATSGTSMAPRDQATEPPGTTMIRVGVSLGAIGVAAGGAALVTLALRLNAESELLAQDGFNQDGEFESVEDAEEARLETIDRGKKLATASIVLGCVSAFYIATGAVIAGNGFATRRRARRASLTPAFSPTFAGLSVEGRF
jgi:hypothetical protein